MAVVLAMFAAVSCLFPCTCAPTDAPSCSVQASARTTSPSGSLIKRRRPGPKPMQLSAEEIRAKFHMSQPDAARALGISVRSTLLVPVIACVCASACCPVFRLLIESIDAPIPGAHTIKVLPTVRRVGAMALEITHNSPNQGTIQILLSQTGEMRGGQKWEIPMEAG